MDWETVGQHKTLNGHEISPRFAIVSLLIAILEF